MCQELSPCIVHGGCQEDNIYCKHFVRGKASSPICLKCTDITCKFELGEFNNFGAGI